MSEYKLVPVEQADEMIRAAIMADYKGKVNIGRETLIIAYKAMLSASPTTDTITIDRTEYEAMKADAERWRYLLSLGKFGFNKLGVYMPNGYWSDKMREYMKIETEKFIDQAIDQERKI